MSLAKAKTANKNWVELIILLLWWVKILIDDDALYHREGRNIKDLFLFKLDTPRGCFSIVYSPKGIYRICFPGVQCSGITAMIELPRPDFAQALLDYLGGKKVDWHPYPLDMSGYSLFTTRILNQVRQIPYGSRETYRQVGENAGMDGGWRAVGQAVKTNRHPLVVPCHRVVAKYGLGGFSGPTGWKEYLLQLEETS